MRLVACHLLVLVSCTLGPEPLGSVRLRPYTDSISVPHVFSVRPGKLIDPDLQLVVDEDGCIRGQAGSAPIELCNRTDKSSNEGERWAGLSGDLTLIFEEQSTRLRTDGYLKLGAGSVVQVQATLLLGQGPQWDELRKHPALLAIAAAVSGVRGEPTELQRAE